MELPVHQVIGGDDATQLLHLCGPGEASNARKAHGYSHKSFAHDDAHTNRELSMNPPRTIGASLRVRMG